MTKKAVEVRIPHNIAAPVVSKKLDKPEPVVMSGYERLVDALATKNAELDAAKEKIEQLRTNLDAVVSKFRIQREKSGEFTKVVQAKGTKANAVYMFKDSYTKIDTCVEENLKRLLGECYSELFERRQSVVVKREGYERLLILAKHHGFLDLLECDEFISPVSNFSKTRYEKRTVLSSEQNKALDDVVRQIAAKPSLSFK